MNQFHIRRAVLQDLGVIQWLQEQWANEDITYGFVPETEEQIRRQLGSYLLVAEVDGVVVGFISGSKQISDGIAVAPEGTAYLEIENLYVTPAFRQQQVGGKLLERLLAVAREEGARKVLVYSATKNVHRILAFYERHGFRSWYIQMFQDL